MHEVLFVSKPLEAPWNDSSKNLARDVAGHLQRYRPRVMVRQGCSNPLEIGESERVYADSVSRGFSLGRRAQIDVFRRLLAGRRVDLWHFFFAPNRRTSGASRLAKRLRPTRSVHTVCSAPRPDIPLKRLLFADTTVVLSRSTFRHLSAEWDPSTIRLIPPCVPAMKRVDRAQRSALRRAYGFSSDQPVLIYPGDIEFGTGAAVALGALAAWPNREATLVMACRDKTPAAVVQLDALKRQARDWGIESRVRWVGNTPHILDFLSLADFVLMMSDSSYAKMDYPLVVLEAMALGTPVFVATGTPVAELAEEGAVRSVAADSEAVAACLEALETDATALSRMIERGHDLVTTRFAPEQVAAQYETVYDELCG